MSWRNIENTGNVLMVGISKSQYILNKLEYIKNEDNCWMIFFGYF